MAKRTLLFLTLLHLAGFVPGFSPIVARFVPISPAAAWAQTETEVKTAPSPSPAVEKGENAPAVGPPEPEGNAAVPEKKDEGTGENLEKILEKPIAVIDQTHARISKGIFTSANWFDSFFADERVESEIQNSRLRLSFSALIEERNIRFETRPNFRLELPLLKDRLNLLLAGDEDEEEFQPASLQEVRRRFLDTSEEGFSASLRYIFISTLKRNFSTRLGVRFRKGIPTLLVEPRYRQSWPFYPWLARFTHRVIGFSDYSMEMRTTFDLDREITKKLLLRHTLDGSWFSDKSGYFYDLQVTAFHRLSNRRALLYGWGNFFRTSPIHALEQISLRVLYRQQIWRKWLFYEAGPQLTFPRERDYELTPGILLRLEAIFGAYDKE